VNVLNRRQLLAAAPLLAAPAVVQAQPAWPNRSVRVIIPFTPGGASDLMMRPVAERLERMLGQSFVIDNRPGGGGAVGVGAAANERPDGYTLLMSTAGPLVLLPSMMANLPYNPARSFTYLSLMGGAPIVCAVRAQSPYQTIQDYAAAARARPEGISFGNSGAGSIGHLAGMLFEQAVGVRLLHVPFRGAPEAQAAVLSGDVTSLWDTIGAHAGSVRQGSLRALAFTSAERIGIFPSVPTVRESGFPSVVANNWFLLAGPAGIPPAIATRINEVCQAAMQEAVVRERMDALGLASLGNMTGAQMLAFVVEETARWAPVARAAG
jgi:tripartite-type tricarboxylate transporter receptor subunit TctC